MEDIYREQILEHARHPHNFGNLEHATHAHEEYNPLCGDQVRIELLIEDNIIRDVRFSGRGCAISQASASMLTDDIKGMSVEEARKYGKEELLELIGIPLANNPVRLKCALLSLKAFKAGLYGIDQIEEEELD